MIPFFAFPPEVRRLIYTTNALESVHAQLRKIIKTRGHFPNDEAATKLIWLALRNITAKWERTAHYWRPAMSQFAILYEDRFSPSTGVKCAGAWTLPEPWTHRTRPPLLGKPHRTRFPTAPTRIIIDRERGRKSTNVRQPASHTKFRTLPPIPNERRTPRVWR